MSERQRDDYFNPCQSPTFAGSPGREPGEEGEVGVAAKPCRQGHGAAEHGFGEIPPPGAPTVATGVSPSGSTSCAFLWARWALFFIL